MWGFVNHGSVKMKVCTSVSGLKLAIHAKCTQTHPPTHPHTPTPTHTHTHREVQLQQQNHLKSTQPSQFGSITHSSFLPPLLVVLLVIFLLLICRHRRGTGALLLSPGSTFRLPRSLSHASGLRAHRRTSSVSNLLALPRNQTSGKLAWIV